MNSTGLKERPAAPEVPDHTLVRLIVSGSYGDVWLARNVIGAYRAVKIIYRSRFEDEKPFERELEGVRRFEPISRLHNALVDILQVGRTDDGACFYYVMELADDATTRDARSEFNHQHYVPRTLRSDIQVQGRLSTEECTRIGLALAEALEFLHGHELVHRDVKPSNIIFVNGAPKLADIGLVARADRAQSLVGTPGFIPLEGPGTPQADIFGLGKVLYEAATGKDRFKFPEPVSDVIANEGLAELNQVIIKACDPDPRRRYQCAKSMGEDLLVIHNGKSLRRMRVLEWRVTQLARAGAIFLLLLLFAVAAWLLQREHGRRLAQAADESRCRLMRLHIVAGLQPLGEQDFLAALPWFSEALKLAKKPGELELQEQRIAAILRQCPRLVALGLHSNAINSAEFSTDGKRVLTASEDGTARVWDALSGEPLTISLRHATAVNSAHFDPSGLRVVTATEDGSVQLWDTKSGEMLATPFRHARNALEASFSHDGRWIVTASEDATARLWDVQSGNTPGPPMSHSAAINHAAFSPNDDLLATCSDDRSARLWKVPGGEPATPPLRHSGIVRWACFSPDGRRLATISDDGTAALWATENGTKSTEPMLHGHQGYYVTFDRSGSRLLTCSGEERNRFGEARIWDSSTGQPVSPPLRHSARIKYACFSPDGNLVATASHDKTVRLWKVSSGEPLGPPLKHSDAVWNVDFTADGNRLLTAGRDGVWKAWDLAVKEWSNAPAPFRNSVGWNALSIANDRAVAASRPRTVKTWMFSPTAREPAPLVHPRSVMAVRINGSGKRVLTGDAAGQVRVWDTENGEECLSPTRHTGPAYSVAFSRDERYIASGGRDCNAQLWDMRTGKCLLFTHGKPVWFVEFSPTEDVLATCSGEVLHEDGPVGAGIVSLWQVKTGRRTILVLGHETRITRCEFSPDGRRIIVGCEDNVMWASDAHVWDTESGKPVFAPLKHSGGITWVCFSPDGRKIATATADGSARVWDADTGKPLTPLFGRQNGLTSICFSPDCRAVLTAGADGAARIWDALTGDSLGPPLKHGDRLSFGLFTPDGQKLFTRESHTANIRVWDCPTKTDGAGSFAAIITVLCSAYIDPIAGFTELTPQQLYDAWQSSRYPAPQHQ